MGQSNTELIDIAARAGEKGGPSVVGRKRERKGRQARLGARFSVEFCRHILGTPGHEICKRVPVLQL